MKRRNLLVTGMIAILLIVLAICSLNTHKDQEIPKNSYQVLLDGKIWFYVQDKSNLEELLKEYKNQYAAKIDKSARIKRIDFKPKLTIAPVDNYSGVLLSGQEAKEKIYATAKSASLIEVKNGDNIWTIARDNAVSVEELQKLNPQLDKEMRIYPGDKLTIKAEKPVLNVIIVYESTVIENIPFATEYQSDSSLYESQRKVVTAGVMGKQESICEIVLENNNPIERKVLNTKVIASPVASKVIIGTKKSVSRSGSSFGIVSGGRITSTFGTRVHPISGEQIFHKGIDIGAGQGSPIYAYASGTIIYAGWKSGYGNFVAIDHGNGLITRYGHMSAIYVAVGQQISVRQRIGAVGSTGASTGPHLHFEVLLNGEYKNPQNYL